MWCAVATWFENLGKRVVKSRRFTSGLVAARVAGYPGFSGVAGASQTGSVLEGFVIEQIVAWAGERNVILGHA